MKSWRPQYLTGQEEDFKEPKNYGRGRKVCDEQETKSSLCFRKEK
jgi:hypothetical protein